MAGMGRLWVRCAGGHGFVQLRYDFPRAKAGGAGELGGQFERALRGNLPAGFDCAIQLRRARRHACGEIHVV